MQRVISVRLPQAAPRRRAFLSVSFFFERVALSLFTCWHRRMSWPITRDHKTYRSCLKCGMCRRFDPQTWKSFGPFYRNDVSTVVERKETKSNG
jgi:hypothetical protein